MTATATRETRRTPVPLRQMAGAWAASLVMLVVAGAATGVAVLTSPPTDEVGAVVSLWLPLLVAPMFAAAASVLVLRAPEARVGEWLQAALPVPGVGAVFMVAVGLAFNGPTLVGLAFVVPALVLLAVSAGSAVTACWAKGRLRWARASRLGPAGR